MRNILNNVVLICISLLVTLLVFELAFRVVVPEAPAQSEANAKPLERLIQFDPVLQTRYRANANVSVKSQYGEFETTYRTNEIGLRDRPLLDNDGNRILVLGNSLVEGWGVEQSDDILSVAERELGGHLGRPIRLVNGGMSGFGAAQSYLLGLELVDKTKPKGLVFVYLSTMVQADHRFLQLAGLANGLATGLNPDQLLVPPNAHGGSTEWYRPWLQALDKYSALSRFISQRLAVRAAQNAIKPGDPDTDLLAGLRADKALLPGLHEPSLRHIKAMSDLAKQRSIPFVVLHLPMPHQVSADEWREGRSAYGLTNQIYPWDDVDVVQAFCASNGIRYSGAHTYLKGALSENDKYQPYYYKFDFHPNVVGTAAIGRWVARELQEIVP